MKVYCDGSCLGNGTQHSSGGYGVVIFDDNDNYISHYSHHETDTTNNIQELKSLIYSFIIAYKNPNQKVVIYSDSSYGIQVFETWARNWKANGWRKADKQPIKNLELIQEGYEIYAKLKNIQIVKVKGHNDILGNEMADALATNNVNKFNRLLQQSGVN
jgi:ribonuclease HI